ncbi:sulfate ABC transporter substrate-binding protein [Candidatus Methylospira mobilis]|uniref:Sulfate ABC transporter substrate-binding protein n=1 Tax=Candidatus Methylospira mobilis TaxID=1808979 RepID=A0A5Q0BRH7_9GAMM|nr:sulfate ABC transporter substrate-binding protein [Candidatus Methylospira mobilis]QFY44677.1 sulfate ABC transporter substrate-binding protein [Candidatus Methylospira mobilis]
MLIRKIVILLLSPLILPVFPAMADDDVLLNASYDVTREFYNEYNTLFIRFWQGKTGKSVSINQSHGGSSKQARAVIDGLNADVVTMNQQTDIDILAEKGLVDKKWRTRFPDNSSPYHSTIVFLVRKGNPLGIKDWNDLIKAGVSPIIPNPKTSGNGRYSYLGAWGYATAKYGSEGQAREFVGKLFKRVPVLDTGGRGATTTFVERGIGDVLLTFENEAYLIARKLNSKDFDVVTPPASIEAEAPVAVVDTVVDKKGTREAAEAYLNYLWSDEGQRLIAKHYFRPSVAAILQESRGEFPELKLPTVEQIAGDWANAQKKHFSDGGIFDQIYSK